MRLVLGREPPTPPCLSYTLRPPFFRPPIQVFYGAAPTANTAAAIEEAAAVGGFEALENLIIVRVKHCYYRVHGLLEM